MSTWTSESVRHGTPPVTARDVTTSTRENQGTQVEVDVATSNVETGQVRLLLMPVTAGSDLLDLTIGDRELRLDLPNARTLRDYLAGAIERAESQA